MRRHFLYDSKWVNLFNSPTGRTTRDLIIHYFITLKCEGIQHTFWKSKIFPLSSNKSFIKTIPFFI